MYDLQQLQKAAIVHDRTLRKPWESTSKSDRPPRRDWLPRRNQSANLADHDDGDDGLFAIPEEELGDDDDEAVPEEVAAEYYESYMTHDSAKQRYKETLKLRGSDPDSLRRLSEERLQAAKARSYCAGCRRRGHWHRDACCPLNKAGGATTTTTTPPSPALPTASKSNSAPKTEANRQHVAHVTRDIQDQTGSDLLAITDTACSRSVAGITLDQLPRGHGKTDGLRSGICPHPRGLPLRGLARV